ncbi:MAG: exodeoxyribonuclease III, partial [Dehalococcoidia bacterium]|nr:exodeoxyribonuclease III [Dehalococcoidia bacterium]
MTRLVSWNVNGIRAVLRKGFLDWLAQEDPDVLCVQELKAQPDQVGLELQQPLGLYQSHFDWGERKGYSGVGVFTKRKPLHVRQGLGIRRFDEEGRLLQVEFDTFTLLTIYFPNGQSSEERLQFKLDYYDAFLEHVENLR